MFRTPRPTTHLLSTATACSTDCVRSFAQGSEPLQTRAEWLGKRPWIVEVTCRSGWPKNRAWRPECSSRRSRCVCQRAKPPPPRLSAQHSVRETPHRRSNSVAEQFDSLTDATIPHLTGRSTPTKAKGSTTESELWLFCRRAGWCQLDGFLQVVQCSNRKVQGRAGAACEAAGLQ